VVGFGFFECIIYDSHTERTMEAYLKTAAVSELKALYAIVGSPRVSAALLLPQYHLDRLLREFVAEPSQSGLILAPRDSA